MTPPGRFTIPTAPPTYAFMSPTSIGAFAGLMLLPLSRRSPGMDSASRRSSESKSPGTGGVVGSGGAEAAGETGGVVGSGATGDTAAAGAADAPGVAGEISVAVVEYALFVAVVSTCATSIVPGSTSI